MVKNNSINIDPVDFYPVGTIYTNKTNSANPSTYLPGQSGSTWTALTDVFLVARGSTYTATGGSASHAHTLSDSGQAKITITGSGIHGALVSASFTRNTLGTTSGSSSSASLTTASGLMGSTDSTTNVPPYQAVYTWERTA